VHKPGEIFGEFCLCGGARNEAAVAMEAAEVVEITLDDLTRHLQQNHAAMYNFLVTICERLSRAYDTIQELSFDRLGDRLAKVLRPPTSSASRPGSTELQHIRRRLAQMLGPPRGVSAALNRLRSEG
jgi:CRP-like cAMP-binding protein